MLTLCHWIDHNDLLQWINANTFLGVVLEVSHYFSMMMIVGIIGIVDLRILGLAARKQNLADLADDLLPWMWIGVVVNAISGLIMFCGEATGYWLSWPFRIKMSMVIIGIVLGIVITQNAPKWSQESVIQPKVKLLALFSMCLWIVLILAGNLVPAISNTG
jgi:hypothetical protein